MKDPESRLLRDKRTQNPKKKKKRDRQDSNLRALGHSLSRRACWPLHHDHRHCKHFTPSLHGFEIRCTYVSGNTVCWGKIACNFVFEDGVCVSIQNCVKIDISIHTHRNETESSHIIHPPHLSSNRIDIQILS